MFVLAAPKIRREVDAKYHKSKKIRFHLKKPGKASASLTQSFKFFSGFLTQTFLGGQNSLFLPLSLNDS
jgi:hypothetical protein